MTPPGPSSSVAPEAGPEIIDFHCHVAAEMCFPPSFRDGVVANIRAALASKGVPASRDQIARLYDSTLNDPWCDALVGEMDAAGVQRAVLLLPDFTYAMKDSSHTIEELVDHHRAVMTRHPGRLLVFAGVDPRWGGDGLDLFERSLSAYGFSGLKLYPPCGYRLNDPALYPFYEMCAAYGVPVLTHIGATSPTLPFEDALPIYVDRPAFDFPSVDFILAHGSVHYPDECAMLCANRPNIYLDISGFEARDPTHLAGVLQRGITHKVLFGTDWPIFRMQGHQSDFVERVKGSEVYGKMSTADRELFLSGNAKRILSKRAGTTEQEEP